MRSIIPVDDWVDVLDDLPRRGACIWAYNPTRDAVSIHTVSYEPEELDESISHWKPFRGSVQPNRPIAFESNSVMARA